ncbi:MAG: putative porin [Candidatus Krumholzibacteria bacterium]|nr:putative porin [Candidatus Krumholzibacteria bacterium]
MKKILIATLAFVLTAPALAGAAEWHEKIKLGGDFRHRYEMIQDESKDADRHRWRIRARLGLTAAVADEVKAQVQLASGGDDPVSTNQTMSDAFSTKALGLDLAYFTWSPKAFEGFSFTGGKMKQPFAAVQKTELVWDGDLNPEGMAVSFERGMNETFDVFVNGGWFSIVERSSSNDTWLAGGQAGFTVKASEDLHLMAGGSYFSYENIKGTGPLYDDSFFGNTSEDDGGEDVFANDFRLFEVLGEIGMKIEKVALTAYGSYVNNTEADSLNTGYLFGASVRHGKGKGAFSLYGNYRKVEADAVIGAFADSDFRGGGTDGSGVELGVSYALADKVSLDGTYFINRKGIEDEVDYNRLLLDIQLKF